MIEFYFACDRCHQTTKGFDFGEMTSGYYDMTGWMEYKQDANEKRVCEKCMWSDPKYIHTCGEVNG